MQKFFKDKGIFKNALVLLLFLVVALVIYYPTLKADPMWDDWHFIFKSWAVKTISPLNFWVWGEHRRSWPMFYTVISVLLKLWKENVLYWHLFSLVLHISNSFLIYKILKRLGGLNVLWIALIYLVHPLNFFTVAWIIQIKTLLAILFFLVSVNYFLEYEEHGKEKAYWKSVCYFGLSLLSKSVFAPIVLIMPFYKKKLRMIPFLLFCIYAVSLTTWSQHLKQYLVKTEFVSAVVEGAYAQTKDDFKKFPMRPILPPEEEKQALIMEGVGIAIKNFSRYATFIVYPDKVLLVQPRTIFSYSNADFIISITTVFTTLCLLIFFFLRKDFLSLIGSGFFIISLIPLCGVIYIRIFHYTNFVEYWMSVPVLGLLICLSRIKNRMFPYILGFFIAFFSLKTIMVSQHSSNPIDVITKASNESPDQPLIKLILAKHYFYKEMYSQSNAVLLNVKANHNVEVDKIDREIEINMKGMNGEKIDSSTL